MSRLVEVCLLVVAAGILCECAKGKNSNRRKFKNGTDHMQGLGNFTDYWKKSRQATRLLRTVKDLSNMTRDTDTSQSTARMCGMNFSVPDFCCKSIVDCSRNVTERLGLFRGAMEKAQTNITTNLNLRSLINKTLDSIKDALKGQPAIVSKDQNSSVGIDQVCNTSGRFDNENVAEDTLRFFSEELENYLSNLKNFTKLKQNLTKVLCQKKNKHASRRPRKTTTTTSKPLDGQNTRQNNTKDYSNQKHTQTTTKMKTKKTTKEDGKQDHEQTTKKMKKDKTTKKTVNRKMGREQRNKDFKAKLKIY